MVSVKSSIALFAAISATMAYGMENDLEDYNDNEIYSYGSAHRSAYGVRRSVVAPRLGYARSGLSRSFIGRPRFLRTYRAGWRRVFRDGVWGYEDPVSVVAAPVVEAPAVAAPVVEAPAVAAPVVEAPVVAAPAVEVPAVVEPVVQPAVIAPCVGCIRRHRHIPRRSLRRAVRRALVRRRAAVARIVNSG
ncbi:Serum response factor-binding protein 1 [Smittium culicis]|uniref:Serum response factor-binding protein 1 n=1 Tax=Smittium culicis TaxID=133412 RepID=A0A1R1XU47_9FUNG|nr:Serum response factor-binding protein 1 [Smittium culicis]